MPESLMESIESKCKVTYTVSATADEMPLTAVPTARIFKLIREPYLIFKPVNALPKFFSVSKAMI